MPSAKDMGLEEGSGEKSWGGSSRHDNKGEGVEWSESDGRLRTPRLPEEGSGQECVGIGERTIMECKTSVGFEGEEVAFGLDPGVVVKSPEGFQDPGSVWRGHRN